MHRTWRMTLACGTMTRNRWKTQPTALKWMPAIRRTFPLLCHPRSALLHAKQLGSRHRLNKKWIFVSAKQTMLSTNFGSSSATRFTCTEHQLGTTKARKGRRVHFHPPAGLKGRGEKKSGLRIKPEGRFPNR